MNDEIKIPRQSDTRAHVFPPAEGPRPVSARPEALAATPEPGLDAKRVRQLLGDHHRLLRTSARNCSICWNERDFIAARLSESLPTDTEAPK